MRQSRPERIFRLTSAILIVVTFSCENQKALHVRTETIRVDSPEQIVLVTDPLVRPLLYINVSGLEKLPVRLAKAKFISAILPSILTAKHMIGETRKRMELLRDRKVWKATDSSFYLDVKNRYMAKDIDDLLIRIVNLPTSLVLAQAAVESGWGKSRIFLKANNLFGIWSYNVNEARIVALRKRAAKKIYVRSYGDISQSVIHYFEILARSRSYQSLRDAHLRTNDPFQLLTHLKNFSERRTAYTNQLKQIIIRNNLTLYDHYQLDPAYLEED